MEYDTTHDWGGTHQHLKQIERRLNDIGSRVKGNQDFQSDRILDVVEQIDELRKELKTTNERLDKWAALMKTKCSKCNGGKDD